MITFGPTTISRYVSGPKILWSTGRTVVIYLKA